MDLRFVARAIFRAFLVHQPECVVHRGFGAVVVCLPDAGAIERVEVGEIAQAAECQEPFWREKLT